MAFSKPGMFPEFKSISDVIVRCTDEQRVLARSYVERQGFAVSEENEILEMLAL